MSSLVRLICPNLRCRAILSVPDAARGKKVKCRQCGTCISVPATAAPQAPRPEKSDSESAPVAEK